MGWFTQSNDDDIDDIYEKLEDIYNRLETVDIVNTFSSRLSRLEKTSAYLENVLLDNLKSLEKRISKLEENQENIQDDFFSVNNCISDIQTTIKNEREKCKVENTPKNDVDHNLMFEIDYLKEDIKSLKMILRNTNLENIKTDFTTKFNEIDEVIKNLILKISYLELSKDRLPNYSEEITTLKEEISNKDLQIKELESKINYLNEIIEDDNKNLKLIAKYVVNQAKDIRTLEDELYTLNNNKNHS